MVSNWQDHHSLKTKGSQLYPILKFFPSTSQFNWLLPVLTFSKDSIPYNMAWVIKVRKKKTKTHSTNTVCPGQWGGYGHHHLRPLVGCDL